MKLLVKIGVFLFACGSCAVLSANESTDNDKLSLDFLEFLGSFETDHGEWLDPMEIDEMLKFNPLQTTTKAPDDE